MRMFTKILLFALTASVFAIPLRIGETWTWQIQGSGTGWRRACVVDSVPLDSSMSVWNYRKQHAGAGLWRIAVLDSIRETWDTARLVSYPDGIQLWELGSNFLAMEFTPLSVLQDSGITPNFGGGNVQLCDLYDSKGSFKFQHGYPWGAGSVLFALPPSQRGMCDKNWFTEDFGKQLFWRPGDEVIWGSAFPWRLADSNGVLRYRDYGRNWELIAHNGQAVSVPSVQWKIPGAGFAWKWTETDAVYYWGGSYGAGTWKETVRHLQDSVIGTLEDSAGWARVDLREADDSASKDYRCRILRSSSGTTKNCPKVAAYWASDWRADKIDDNSILDVRSCTDGHYSVSCEQWFTKIRAADGLLDSGYTSSDCRGYGVILYSMGIVTVRLISVNGVAVRSEPVAAIRKDRIEEKRSDWSWLAKRFPQTQVRWHDLQGRFGTILAGELLKQSVNSRLLLLEATVPDGSHWQGTFLTGSGR